MALSWLALTLSAVIILRLSSVSLPAELGGFASFPLEELEHDDDDGNDAHDGDDGDDDDVVADDDSDNDDGGRNDEHG